MHGGALSDCVPWKALRPCVPLRCLHACSWSGSFCCACQWLEHHHTVGRVEATGTRTKTAPEMCSLLCSMLPCSYIQYYKYAKLCTPDTTCMQYLLLELCHT